MLMLGDYIVSGVAIFLGLALREWQRTGEAFGRPPLGQPPMFFPMLAAAGGLLFVWFMILLKSYELENLYKMRKFSDNLVITALGWSIAVWAGLGLAHTRDFSPRVGVVYCAVLLFALIIFWRLALFVFLMQPAQREAVSSRVVVVGWNEKATHVRNAMRRDLAQLSEIIGCVPLPDGTFASTPPAEVAILGSYAALPRLLAECQAHSVILADVSCPRNEIQELISFCQRELITFQMVPGYFPALSSGLQVQTISGVPLLGISRLPLDRTGNRLLKRFFDVTGSLLGLLVSLPIIALFGLLVYIESPGPIIYRQKRTGRSGRTFFIYKVRSMRMNAEAQTGAVWCTQDDPRRLKVGSFMRKYNIDELPQFWNVLKGDMSLVGPRPERPELIEKFKGEIPNYNARHEVRTGLTGWAQVNGLRGNTDLTKRVEADLYYLENWSLMLDLYCVAATVFNNKNAH